MDDKYKLELIKRVIAWNAARYDQVYSHQLQIDLLAEEENEYTVAETDVDKLDAVADTMFVCIGALWKLGNKAENILNLIKYVDNVFDEQMLYQLYPGPGYTVDLVYFGSTYFADPLRWYALEVVCYSNETKAIKKTDPSIKANIDKGQEYIPPTEGLLNLLSVYHDLVQGDE